MLDRKSAERYPTGIGASYQIVENLIRGRADVLAMWTEVTKRGVGAPHGNQNAAKADTIVDNIHDCLDRPPAGNTADAGNMLPIVDNAHDRSERPSGTSAAAGLRKLQKAAAEGNPDANRPTHVVLRFPEDYVLSNR